jgi:tetratricopeptide (TPR) repeat protein
VLLRIGLVPGVIKFTNMASAAQAVAVRQSEATIFNSATKRNTVLSLLLLLVTLVAYNPAAHNNFVKFDDPEYITVNPHVRSGLSWSTFKWSFRATEQANWHPLTWLSHSLDATLFHLNPAGHHYMNVLLHATTAILLFLFLQAAAGFVWRSLMVAALFATHPLNVESVAWAAERKNVLCMLFCVLTLMAYWRYAQKARLQNYVLIVAAFTLALMSKPMAVTLPFVMLLVDYWPLQRNEIVSFKRLIAEKLPFLAMSIGSCIVTMIAQRSEGAIHSGDFSLSNRLQNAVVCYAVYLRKLLWPSTLASFYPHPEHIPLWQLAIAIIVLSSITAGVLWRREEKYLAIGWLWFLGTMVPMIGIVQAGEQGMADRYAYLPLIGLFIALTWGFCEWAESLAIQPAYLAVPALCILGLLGAVTHHQIGYWKDTKTLWAHTLSITSRNYVAEASMGAELIAEGQLEQAMTHLKAGIAINPRDPFSRLDLGVCEKRLGHVDEAIADYEAALQLARHPTLRSAAYGNLGSIYRSRGDYAMAGRNYEAALRLDPNGVVALTGLGVIAQKTKNPAAAINYYTQAVNVQPSDSGYLLLSQALAQAGRQKEADGALMQAQLLSQNWSATVATVNHLLQPSEVRN